MSRLVGTAEAAFWLGLTDASKIDWDEVARRLPFALAMKSCIQDATYHAEGDVWTHTVMVIEELRRRRNHAMIAPKRWPVLFQATLLHDVAKPATRSEETGADGARASSPLRPFATWGYDGVGIPVAGRLIVALALVGFIVYMVFGSMNPQTTNDAIRNTPANPTATTAPRTTAPPAN
jgi:hypothetical protein